MSSVFATSVSNRLSFALIGTFIALLPIVRAQALDLSFGDITGTLNTNITVGGQIRMQSPADDLIGKSNLDPNVCGVVDGINYQSCQAVFRDQLAPSQKLAAAPGAPGMRADDGDLNYKKHDLTQAVAMAAQDMSLNWGRYGFFARWLYFYDFVNNDFDETKPNVITAENLGRVGISGDREANRYYGRVYGAGASERIRRTDGETLRQIGTDFQLMDINVFGVMPLWGDREINWKVGRQNLNWGESTTIVVNSLNQINPPNANNLYRVGAQLDQVFQPVGMLTLSGEAFDNIHYEAFYQFEWRPLEAPATGSYMSYADFGTNNARDYGNLSFGGSADDPDGLATPLNSPLALVTPTSARAVRDPDREPENGGQYGFSLKYYAENINSGTEFGLYFMNYHSRLPYVSFTSTDASCARREGNALGLDARNTTELFAACNNLPAYSNLQGLSQVLGQAAVLIAQKPGALADLGGNLGALLALAVPNPDQPFSDLSPLSTGRVFLEYPEDIQLYGWSFNTAYGDYSFQGEIAYRPNLPLQVSITDLEFAAAGPTLTRCSDRDLACAGTTGGRGIDANGVLTTYGSSDFLDANGNNPYADTINLLIGTTPGSARSFPSFVVPYRGGTLGETAPNSYIRGYQRFDVLQYNLGLTRVLSGTENWLHADQIQMLVELGATHVPGLPSYDRLQIESPGVYYHASAGADGTGANGSRQACSTNPTCSVGADGLRFNPHQANLDDLVDKFSWGYRLIAIGKYESVLPGISLAPQLIFFHDVNGTAPGPGENFVEDRKQLQTSLETRYRDALSLTLGYTWFWGGGYTNLYRDRDFAQAFVRYQF